MVRAAERWIGEAPGTAPEYDRAPSWRDEAACKGQDHAFFDNDIETCKALCASCPVLEPCLDDALTRSDEWFQGGMTWRQRKTEKQRRFGKHRLFRHSCVTCGTSFDSPSNTAKFCSSACRQVSHRARWAEHKRLSRAS